MKERNMDYSSPFLDIVSIEAEDGFAGSGDFVPNDFRKGEENWLYGTTPYSD